MSITRLIAAVMCAQASRSTFNLLRIKAETQISELGRRARFAVECQQHSRVQRSCPIVRQVAGDSIQLNRRIRRSFVLEALPCQPQLGLVQARSSFPNIFIASVSESDALVHFLCKLML